MSRNASLFTIASFALLTVAFAQDARASILASTFTSVSGLDVNGTFIAAENENGSAVTIGDVTFAAGSISTYFTNPDGPSGAGVGTISGANLQTLMSTLIFKGSAGAMVGSVSGLTPGREYKVQLLFNNEDGTIFNPWTVVVESETLSGFQAVSNISAPGQVVTADFIAGVGDSTLNMSIVSEGGANNNTVYLNALSVEAVPEPASMGILAIGSLGLVLRNRRRAN